MLKRYTLKLLVLAFLIVVPSLSWSSAGKMNFTAGDICSVDSGEGDYSVIKLLVITEDGAHVRLYKNKFSDRPKSINVESLSLGKIGEAGGFGIGHVPLDVEAFLSWNPVCLINTGVSEEELEGYNFWLSR